MQSNEIKEYLRIDEEEDISSFLLSAKAYIRQGTGFNEKILENIKDLEEKQENIELYNLALKMLVSHFYENRVAIVGKNNVMPFGIESILIQLESIYLRCKDVE